MKQAGPRTYQVVGDDFPVAVVVRARNLKECITVISNVHVLKGAAETGRIEISVTSDDALLSKSYSIDEPQEDAPCDLVQSINGWFGKKPVDSARYELAITGARGDEFKTTIRVPSINPGIANLTFQYR